MTARSADHEAAEQLVIAHADAIWRYVRRRVPTVDHADDLAAEVFAIAWRSSAHRLPADEQRLWLFGVARRTVLADARRRHRHLGLVERLSPSSGTVPDVAARTELGHALDALPELDREVLLLRAWDGWPVTDIARFLGVTPNAVSVRLHKARVALADALDLDTAGRRTASTSSETS